jgi:peptidoglycan/xylan/chitin deacetylase (PgdA/CDA1 family)
MRTFLKAVGVLLLGSAAALVVFSYSNTAVPILMYHSIGDPGPAHTPAVDPETFARQIDFLKRNGFKVISLEEFISASDSAKLLPYKCVVITFDDGYENNYHAAYPVLRDAGYPATLFVPADFIGRPGYITAVQANEMSTNYISIGAHGKNHEYLPALIPEKLHREIRGAKKQIETSIGRPVRLFCYPLGGFTAQTKKWVKSAGYIGACTTNRSPSFLNKDIYALNRIKMTGRDAGDALLWAKTSRIYNVLRGVRNHFRNAGCAASSCM